MSYSEHISDDKKGNHFTKTWVLKAPWAHPLWHSYAVIIYDLTTKVDGLPDPVIYMEGATHELMVLALNPEKPVGPGLHFLRPANHGYQFKADSNEAATARVIALLDEMAAGILSPDTDFRSMWDVRFRDGVSLLKGGGANA